MTNHHISQFVLMTDLTRINAACSAYFIRIISAPLDSINPLFFLLTQPFTWCVNSLCSDSMTLCQDTLSRSKGKCSHPLAPPWFIIITFIITIIIIIIFSSSNKMMACTSNPIRCACILLSRSNCDTWTICFPFAIHLQRNSAKLYDFCYSFDQRVIYSKLDHKKTPIDSRV